MTWFALDPIEKQPDGPPTNAAPKVATEAIQDLPRVSMESLVADAGIDIDPELTNVKDLFDEEMHSLVVDSAEAMGPKMSGDESKKKKPPVFSYRLVGHKMMITVSATIPQAIGALHAITSTACNSNEVHITFMCGVCPSQTALTIMGLISACEAYTVLHVGSIKGIGLLALATAFDSVCVSQNSFGIVTDDSKMGVMGGSTDVGDIHGLQMMVQAMISEQLVTKNVLTEEDCIGVFENDAVLHLNSQALTQRLAREPVED